VEGVGPLAALLDVVLAKVPVEVGQDIELCVCDRRIIDQRSGSSRSQEGLEIPPGNLGLHLLALGDLGNGLHVDVEDIQEQPARGMVGIAALGAAREEGVKRLNATTPPPASAVNSTRRVRSVKWPMPQLRAERTA
jgi:hypothetical protein